MLDFWWVPLVPVVSSVLKRYAPVVERALELRMAKWVIKQDKSNVKRALDWCRRSDRDDEPPDEDGDEDEPFEEDPSSGAAKQS